MPRGQLGGKNTTKSFPIEYYVIIRDQLLVTKVRDSAIKLNRTGNGTSGNDAL